MTENERPEIVNETLALEEEDRLPWLEAVDTVDDENAVSPGRLIGLVLGGLGALAVLVGGIWWMQNRQANPQGQGELIAAAEGDYKVAPANPDAKQFQGEGDASFKASQGNEVNGKIDPTKAPETPATAAAAKGAAPAATVAPAAMAANGAKPTPAATTPAGKATIPGKAGAEPAAATAPAGAATVQLGAFNSEAVANKAWAGMAKRFGFLSGLNHTVTSATVGGGTVYRLRASVGSAAQAADICSKMSAAGQNCMVVR